jgi:nicotinate dehydrogenase subunit A
MTSDLRYAPFRDASIIIKIIHMIMKTIRIRESFEIHEGRLSFKNSNNSDQCGLPGTAACRRTASRRQRHSPMARMTLDMNGKVQTIDADPDMPLLYALRNELSLNNPHFGCGLAQCGACTVHVDGQAVRSCVTPVSAVGSSKVVTLAGLGTPEKPHPIQKAYVEEQVPQCGYCINGWIMTAAAFLNQTKKPTDAQIREALTGLKCRCGTHMGILRAVKRAAAMMG